MLQCRQCGSVYEDDSSYCNVCDIDFTEFNSVYVIDAEQAKQQYTALKNTLLLIKRGLYGIAIFFPFLLYVDAISILHTKGEKLLVLGLIESLTIGALISTYKNWQMTRKVGYILGVLLLFLFPIASPFGILLLFMLTREEWRWLNQK